VFRLFFHAYGWQNRTIEKQQFFFVGKSLFTMALSIGSDASIMSTGLSDISPDEFACVTRTDNGPRSIER